MRKTTTLMIDSFFMKEGKSIDNMFGIQQVLLKGLEALGHTFTKAKINLDMLDNFPKMWEPNTTTIQEAKNMKTLS